MKLVQKKIKAAILLAAVSLVASSCGMLPVEEEALIMPTVKPFVALEHRGAYAARGDLRKIQKVTGYFRPNEQANLGFLASGRVIKNVYVEEGSPVKSGELLAELYNDDIINALEEKKIHIQKIKLELEYLEKIKNQDINLANKNGQKYEPSSEHLNQKTNFESQLQLANLEIEKLNAELENTKIYSTIDGNVSTIKDYNYSTYPAKGDYFMIIKDTSSTYLGIDKSQTKYFAVGDEVSVIIGSTEYTGAVQSYEEENQYCDYYILIENLPPDTQLGQSSSITVILEERQDVVYVPKAAVNKVEGQSIVYKLDEQGERIFTEVTIGLETTEFTEILEGITEGQIVSLD